MLSSSAPSPARLAAIEIVQRLRAAGHTAYFAGGCVRDELLGVTPDDYDVATDAVPDRVMALFPRSGEVGKSFGVVIVKVGGEVVVEVATFRADGDYTDSRRPDSVRFSSPQEDAERRDYTVNALFLDPLAPSSHGSTTSPLGGMVIDLIGGLPDLTARVLRAVGDPDKRLAEDHLRALRAARLAAKLDFAVEPATANAIRAHAAELRGVSRERVGDEVRRMLLHPSRAGAAWLVADLGLVGPVFLLPDGAAIPTMRNAKHLAALPGVASAGASLAAWALDQGSPLDEGPLSELLTRWRRALCLSNDEREALAGVLRLVRTLRNDWSRLAVAGQKRLAANDRFADALCLFGVEAGQAAAAVHARVNELAQTPEGLAPKPFVTGDDLVAMGLTPGPGFKVILDGVYDAQLEGRAKNVDEARELARGWRV